jgi:hypothetical protein
VCVVYAKLNHSSVSLSLNFVIQTFSEGVGGIYDDDDDGGRINSYQSTKILLREITRRFTIICVDIIMK